MTKMALAYASDALSDEELDAAEVDSGLASTAVYARLSKAIDGDYLGVERQEKLCRRLAKDRGLPVSQVYVDNDLSAFNPKVHRPAFEQLLRDIEGGVVTDVLVYHTDRLYRQVKDLERLVPIVQAAGARIHTVAAGEVDLATASGRMIARMLGAAAQHESERTSERMKQKMDEMAAAGKPPGGRPPYGYRRETRLVGGRVESRYVKDKAEAKVVALMAELILEGDSLFAVARELQRLGVKTREGKAVWPTTTVRATVTKPAVAGLRVHRGEIAGAGEWEPILDRATWEQVVAVIRDPARKRTRPVRKHLLSGLVVDERSQLMMGVVRSQGGTRKAVYRTHLVGEAAMRSPGPGTRSQVLAEELERLVVDALLAVIDQTPLSPRDLEGVVEEASAASAASVAELEAELAEFEALRGAKKIGMQTWLSAKADIEARITEARQRVVVRQRRAMSKVERLLADPGALRREWQREGGLTFEEKREALALVIDKVTVRAPARAGRWTKVVDRVHIDWRM